MLEHALEGGREIHTFEKQFKIKYFLIRSHSILIHTSPYIWNIERVRLDLGIPFGKNDSSVLSFRCSMKVYWTVGDRVCTFVNLQSQFLLFHSEVVNISALRD